jgi:hypothetical protein
MDGNLAVLVNRTAWCNRFSAGAPRSRDTSSTARVAETNLPLRQR